MNRHLRTQAIVLKRVNYSDADRFITLFTDQKGKVSARARGVRKLTSRKRSALEPINLIKASLVETKAGLLITEAQLVTHFPETKTTLTAMTQAMQFLEIVDNLTAEEEPHPQVFNQVAEVLYMIEHKILSRASVLQAIKNVLDELGFGYPNGSEELLKNHIESLTQKPLRSKQFLLDVI